MFRALANNKLLDYLQKNLKYPTVLLSAIVLLEFYFADGEIKPYSKVDIERAFNKKRLRFGINTFRRDYIKRQSGVVTNLIDENEEEQFFIRQEFLSDGVEALQDAVSELYRHYFEKNQVVQNLLDTIHQAISSCDEIRAEKILFEMLEDGKNIGTRRGQSFEISSFAVMRQYFLSFGYHLNRFSVTVANDGGMDFVGQHAIFQVAEVMGNKKFEEDIQKLPNTPRIIVYHRLQKNFDIELFEHPDVLRHVSLDDIKDFYENLKHQRRSHLFDILETMYDQLGREIISV